MVQIKCEYEGINIIYHLMWEGEQKNDENEYGLHA